MTSMTKRVFKTGQLPYSPKFGSDDDWSTTSGSAGAHGGPPSSRENTPDHIQALGFNAVLHEIQELRENKGHLEESFQNLTSCHQQDYAVIVEALHEERYRSERLQEQLNDLIELHQNEILNLKEELASMEETAHHYNQRPTDIHEALQACQTRLFKMEQQQQVVQLEGLENTTAQTVLGTLIDVLLAVMVVILLFVSTVFNCVATFNRMLYTLLFVVLFSFLWMHWDPISDYPKYFFCTQHPDRGDR